MKQVLTPQKLTDSFLFDLCHGKTTFDHAPSNLTEAQILSLKVALIDGWEDIRLFNTASPKYSFVGTNERLKHQYGVHIPDYAESLDAIWGVFSQLQLKSFDVREISELNTGFAYEACISFSFSIQDIQRRAETPAIALCELLIAIAP